MARPAPGADRSVAVLDLLAGHPEERFTLSEVARRCRMNKATAHALLTALAEHGILLRHPDEKRYSLGPRLVEIGEAARRGYSVLDFLPAAVERLAAQTGSPACARRVIASQLVVVASAGGPPGLSGASHPRLPLMPPVGALLMAWVDEPAAEAWLARAAAADSVRQAIDALPRIRELGVAITPWSPGWAQLSAPVPPGCGPPSHEDQRALFAEAGGLPGPVPNIDEGATYKLADVEAPVFGSHGQVEVGLGVTGLGGREVTGAELRKLVEQVQGAAARLTSAIRGRRPDSD
jgi:DNA-binding IclR family transcriptional regulator